MGATGHSSILRARVRAAGRPPNLGRQLRPDRTGLCDCARASGPGRPKKTNPLKSRPERTFSRRSRLKTGKSGVGGPGKDFTRAGPAHVRGAPLPGKRDSLFPDSCSLWGEGRKGYRQTLTLPTRAWSMANGQCRRCRRAANAGAYSSSRAVANMANALNPFFRGRR